MKTELTIIIISFNTRDMTKNCIESVLSHTRNIEFEIIVVDNNSNDGSQQMLKNDFPQIQFIENQNNVGYAKANNQAIEISKGDKILLLNSDTLISDDSIKKMAALLDKNPSVGIVGSKLLNEDGTYQLSCGIFPSLWSEFSSKMMLNRLFKKSRIFNAHKYGFWDYSNTKEVDWVTGAFLMVRKDAIDIAGGLDENFFMFYEDVDFCKRVKSAGWKIFFYPEASIIHLWGGSWKKVRKKIILANCKSTLYFYRKHHQMWQVHMIKMVLSVECLVKIVGSFLSFLVLFKRRSVSRERLAGYGASLQFIFQDS